MTSDLFEVGGRVFWRIKVRETAKLLTSNPLSVVQEDTRCWWRSSRRLQTILD